MSKIKHAVILMAGKGTRFLPATKAVAKELFPVGNKPALLFQLKECLDSGIEEVTIVISKQKKGVKNFLKHDSEVENLIKGTSKESLLEEWNQIIDNLKINFVYQGKMNGSAGATYVTKKFIKNQPFAVISGDDVCIPSEGQKPALKELIETFERTGKSVMGAVRVPDDAVDRYGIVVPGEQIDDKTFIVNGFVEKPKKGTQPSNLATLLRYVVKPEIYLNILKCEPKENGEVLLPEALSEDIKNQDVVAHEFSAKYYDLGNKLEFVKCVIENSLKDDEISAQLTAYIKGLNI